MAATRRRRGCLVVSLLVLTGGGAWLASAVRDARIAAQRTQDL
jgi:hypothetical protein